jgi:hypothetical protein
MKRQGLSTVNPTNVNPNARGNLRRLPRMGVTAALAAGTLFLAACDDEYYTAPPPCVDALAPVGLYSVTGDRAVTVYWIPVAPEDVSEYVVYRSGSPDGPFREVGHSARDYFVDGSVVNGVTYFYGVTALNRCGNETELSREIVFDTPRPEGFGDRIYDANGVNWPRSGWEFALARTLPWDHADADVYFILADGVGYLVATDSDTDIQDAGFGDFDSVDWAPVEGWSPTGTVEVIPGHVYVVWTWDNHFAKVRARSVGGDSLVFDWAYQVDPGNQELGPRPAREAGTLSLRPGR